MLAGTTLMCAFGNPCRAADVPEAAAPEQTSAPASASASTAAPLAEPGPAAAAAQPAAASGAAPDFMLLPPAAQAQGLKWRAPPLAWAGSIAYDQRVDHRAGRAEQIQQLVTARFGASTYLYQPWLATLSAQLGLSSARVRGHAAGLDSEERFVTGQTELNLLPRSRFPLELRYEASDSRINPALAQSLSFRSHELSVTQRYRPESGQWQLGAGYTRRDQIGFDAGRDEQRTYSLDASGALGAHHLALNLSDQRAERQQRAEQALYHTIIARHSYVPSSQWSIETSGNWTRTDQQFGGERGLLRMAQGSTLAFWRPEGRPWSLSASARAMSLDDELDGGHLQTLGSTLGATWALTDTLRLAASASSNRVESGALSEQSLTRSLGASWQAESIRFGEYRYDLHAGLTAADLRARTLQERSVTGQVGHALSRSWSLAEDGGLHWSLSQSLSAQHTRLSGQIGSDPGAAPDSLTVQRSQLDTHSTALTWQSAAAGQAYARASYSDAREFGGNGMHFQLLNLQASGQIELDRWRSLSGDMTWQQVRQRAESSGTDTALLGGASYGSRSVGSELNYQQRRLWRVSGLRLGARLRVARDILQSTQTLALLPERETRLAELRLDYQIGRLDTSVLLRRARLDGEWRDLLMLRVQRSLGGGAAY